MSQALKFRSKLAVSLFSLMASSGVALAQQAQSERPAITYSAAQPAGASTPSTMPQAPTEGTASKLSLTPTVNPVVVEKAVPAPAPVVRARVIRPKRVAKASAPTKSVAKESVESETLKFKAPLPGEVEVSDRDYNHFIFPSAITQLVFPPGSPIVGKPVYLNNNTQALVEIPRGADKPIQMIVETESGRVTKLYLKPRPINGITYRVDGAREAPIPSARSNRAKSADGAPMAPHGEDVELLKRAVQGDIPSDFESIALPRPTRFDRFTVVPLAGWTNGSRRILSFSLVAVAGKTAVVTDPQFYRAGITAVLLTGDHVDESTSPQLFVIEEVAYDE